VIYFYPYFVIAIGLYGIYKGESWVWLSVVILFFINPIIEYFMKEIQFNSNAHKSRLSEVSLLLTPVALTAVVIVALLAAQKLKTGLEFLGLVLSTGAILGAYGITSAHELVHRRQSIHRAVGVYNLMLVHFAHWGIEHVFGHHKSVATPVDPATARQNEWLYSFWVRSYFGVLKGAFRIAQQKVLFYWTVSLLLSVSVFFILGWKALVVWWSASVVATLLLQSADYIEHYGLQRPKNSDGFYMAFKAHHAWDTSSILTNISLFNLGLHSHHHMKPLVVYEELVAQPEARQMPYGYSIMILLALFPFIYIPMMNKKIAA
jgi:alkane 1-monooxygenase